MSPKATAWGDLVDEGDGRLSSTDRTKLMRACGASDIAGDHVLSVAVTSVWYAVDRTSLAAGSDGFECGAVRRSRLECGQTTDCEARQTKAHHSASPPSPQRATKPVTVSTTFMAATSEARKEREDTVSDRHGRLTERFVCPSLEAGQASSIPAFVRFV